MEHDSALIAHKLRRWEKYLNNYRLPEWHDIPNVGLYMEQVLNLLKDYLDYLPPELKDEQFITAATINNYVRKKFMPEPFKKKYYRIHIAYLIIICTLKHSLSIATLQKMIPIGLEEDEVREIYTAYAARHKMAADSFVDTIKKLASPMLGIEADDDAFIVDNTTDLITVTAIISGFTRLLAEKLLLLDGRKMDEPIYLSELTPEEKS